MANDIFTRAKAYRKKHPRTAWADCVKAVAGKKKSAVSGVKHKRKTKTVGKAAPAKKTTKIRIKPTKKGGTILSISGISLNKTRDELHHQSALTKQLQKHQQSVKAKGLTPAEKAHIKREILQYKNAIKTSKAHVSALKRSI